MKRFCSLLLTTLLLCSCAAGPQQAPELLTPVKVRPDSAVAEVGDIFDLTYREGAVVPAVEPASFSTDGVIAEICVLPGQEVKKGDVLAVLETEALQKRLDALRAELNQGQTAYASLNRSLSLDIQIKQLELQQMQQSGAPAAYELQLKELELEEAKLQQKQAKESQAASQKQLNVQIEEIVRQISNTAVTAPIDGAVVWISVNAVGGRFATAGSALFYIADPSRLLIRTERISPSLLQTCDRIYAQIGDREYGLVPQETDINDDIAKALDGLEMKTTYSFTEDASELSPGGNAIVCCRSNFKAGVLSVPANALYRDQDGAYVYRLEGDEKKRVPVEIGVRTALRVEILSGLTEGDEVYVKD